MATQENCEPPDFCPNLTGRDSGISSFSSDCSDSIYPSSFLLDAGKVGTISKMDNGSIIPDTDSFCINFLGEYSLSRRHTPSMIPWIVEEITGRKCSESVIMSVVKRSAFSDYSVLKIRTSLNQSGKVFFETRRNQVELEHSIKSLTRFSKSFRNPKRFSYLFRQSSDSVFTCYVYEAESEDVVNNLFYEIHNAMLTAPRAVSEPSSPPPSASNNLFEVLYIGKVVVATKKAPPTFVDEAVKKFEELAKLDSEETKVNDLETIVESQDESIAHSTAHEQDEDFLHSNDSTEASDGQQLKESLHDVKTSTECIEGSLASSSSSLSKSNRKSSLDRGCEALFVIGQDEICLLSQEYKHPLKEWKFKDISFCSQGIICCNHFGFIARNPSTMNYIYYIFKCQSEATVDEIMLTMRKAFQAAFERSSRSLVVCELCPMHQLHKLCLLLENMDQSMIHKMLLERIEHLSEHCSADDFYRGNESYNVPTLFEMNVHLMSFLLHLCEMQQQHHEHINDRIRGSREKPSFDLFSTHAEKGPEAKVFKLPMVEDVNGNETNLSRLCLEKWEDGVKQRRHSVPHSLPLGAGPREGGGPCRRPSKGKSLAKEGASGDVVFMDKIIPEDSPIRSMFLKVGNGGGARTRPHLRQAGRSSSVSSSSSSTSASPSTSLKSLLPVRHRGAWQINILSSIQLSGRCFEDDFFSERTNRDRTFHPKSTWKKAIGDTILLIKINKKNEQRNSSEDEIDGLGGRVDYVEVTPSLKEVTDVWKQILDSDLWKSLRLDSELLANSVKDGIPKELRGRIWKLLVHQNRILSSNKLHNSIQDDSFNCDAVDYEILKRQLTSHQHAILIDLGRTFPGHPYFAAPSGPGQAALFNVLKAYSVLDAEVGYCQGLSFVVGVLLIHVGERDAFEILKHIMFRLDFRRQYKPDMVPLQIRMYQLTRMLHDSYRDLYEHLETHQIAPTLYAAPWFLTIFASQFPLGFVARVFDLIFAFGTEVVLKVALVLLGNHRELIKQCTTFEAIVDFLKVTLPDMAIIQMERIFNQVFQLDVSTTLEAYEVEYHILHEEMSGGGQSRTPQGGVELHEKDKILLRISRIQLANESLRRQKMELLEQLQTARRQIRTLEAENASILSNEVHLKSQNRILELERNSLLYTIEKLNKKMNSDDGNDNNNNNNNRFSTSSEEEYDDVKEEEEDDEEEEEDDEDDAMAVSSRFGDF